MDFGLARVVNENEQVREIMGTPEFVGESWNLSNCLAINLQGFPIDDGDCGTGEGGMLLPKLLISEQGVPGL